MNHPRVQALVAAITLIVWSLGAMGCADRDMATLSLGLYPDADYFTLQIYTADDVELYDTGCLEKRAQTFRISNLDVTEDAWVEFHYYADVACNESSHIGVGLRGGVAIVAGEERYYHVPVLADGNVTPLPVELNVSAGFAVEVAYCESDAECVDEVDPGGGCYKVFDDPTQKYLYWCVPTCQVDSDCADMHGGAICDPDTRWCTLPSPFPLNMAGPRAFGQASTMPDGDVLLIGGFSSLAAGQLTASGYALERYDAATGLFEAVSWTGDEEANVALAGMASLGGGLIALVGGVTGAEMGDNGLESFAGARGHIVVIDPSGAPCGEEDGSDCVPAGSVMVHEDAMKAVVDPGVLVSDDGLVVIGGLRPGDDGELSPSTAVTLCAMEQGDYVCTQVATLAAARVGPEIACLTETCDQLMVLGGHTGGSPVEVFDWNRSEDTPTVETQVVDGLTGSLQHPTLCGGRLVGGVDADGVGLAPVALSVDRETQEISANSLENTDDVKTTLHPAVYGPADGDCWVLGGQSGTEASTAVRRITADAVAAETPGVSLERGRYGASLAVINSGPLAGSVMVAGGLTYVDLEDAPIGASRDRLVNGAEIFRP